jgi:hypothetical protein
VNGGSEDPAIRVVEELGGECYRPADYVDTYRPPWVDEVEGNPVVEVNLQLQSHRVNDETVARLSPLRDLRWLILSHTGVTDEGLKTIATFQDLRELNLFDTRVTDAGLAQLAGLKRLESLDLGSTRITDAGLKHIANL